MDTTVRGEIQGRGLVFRGSHRGLASHSQHAASRHEPDRSLACHTSQVRSGLGLPDTYSDVCRCLCQHGASEV
eukprot:218315-Heterocapsa_arctica.AAC.1